MTRRTRLLPATQPAPSSRERLEDIHTRSQELLDAIKHGESGDELQVRALEIQGVACVGAAFERRRERGE